MTDDRCANPAYQLEVDEMILDYLIYSTTKALLSDAKDPGRLQRDEGQDEQNTATVLAIFDSFIQIFHQNHASHRMPRQTLFGIKLLELIVLFTQRRRPTLLTSASKLHFERVCDACLGQRSAWRDRRRRLKVSTAAEEARILHFWSDFSPDTTATSSHEDRIILEGILPRFLSLSAESSRQLGVINEQWMDLASDFMLQTALDAYLHFQGAGDVPLWAAFAWGWLPNQRAEVMDQQEIPRVPSTTDESEDLINDMFQADDSDEEREVDRWQGMRLKKMSVFAPLEDEDWHTAGRWEDKLNDIAFYFPEAHFERRVLDYLESLWGLNAKPILVQIEQGRVDGMTDEELRTFKMKVGFERLGRPVHVMV